MTAHKINPHPQQEFTDQLRAEAAVLVGQLASHLEKAIAEVDERLPLPPDPDRALATLDRPLPDAGAGTRETIEELLDLQEKADRTGHGYFHSSPEASSDLIMTIRYGMRPGVEGGRPLTRVGPVFWRIEPGYPFRIGLDPE